MNNTDKISKESELTKKEKWYVRSLMALGFGIVWYGSNFITALGCFILVYSLANEVFLPQLKK